MGQLQRLEAEDEILFREWLGQVSAKPDPAQPFDLADDGDPLSAARGAVWGVILGSIMWSAILWGLL